MQEIFTASKNQSDIQPSSIPGCWLIIDQKWDEGFSAMFEVPIEVARSIVPKSVMINFETAIELNRKLMAMGQAVETRVLLEQCLLARDYQAVAEIAQLQSASAPLLS